MKILILMPLDEKMVYAATGIYKALPAKYKDCTFNMPYFMEYLVSVKLSQDWTTAMLDAIASAKQLYKAAGKRDFILIGNIQTDFKFDKIFNFQDIENSEPYKDSFLEKVQDITKEDQLLNNFLGKLYKAEDSVFALHNCVATADFISNYMKTDPHLEEIKERYENKLKELDKKYGTTIFNK